MQQEEINQGNIISTQKPIRSKSNASNKVNAQPNEPSTKRNQENVISIPTYGEDFIKSSQRKDELIEVRTFLPSIAEGVISGRYESPLRSLKMSAGRWKMFTLTLALFSFCYFALHLWVTMGLTNYNVQTASPRAIHEVSNFLVKVQDMLYYNYTMNLIMDGWALVIYMSLILVLLSESYAKFDTEVEEKGRFEKIMARTVALVLVLFALSYILGTVIVFWGKDSEVNARDMGNLIIFHLSKMIYLLLNVIAFKKYKSAKFIYEDLLIEALGPSEAGDKSQSEIEEIEEGYNQKSFPKE